MELNSWIIWIVCIGVFMQSVRSNHFCEPQNNANCSNHNTTYFVMATVNRSLLIVDNFSRVFCQGSRGPRLESNIFVQDAVFPKMIEKWPKAEKRSGSVFLHLTKWHTENEKQIYVLSGINCSGLISQTNVTANCTVDIVATNQVCEGVNYNENTCLKFKPQDDSKYFVNVTANECINCNNPAKLPDVGVDLNDVISGLPPSPTSPEEPLDPMIAIQVMSSMTSEFAAKFKESTVALTLSKSVTGVLMKQTDPLDLVEVSFGYTNVTQGFNILQDRNTTRMFSRSVTLPKEAFQKAMSLNISEPFAAVFRFLNMSKDEHNSTVLGDEVIAIEMGTIIKNLTDTININFFNMNYKGNPSCFSWKGNESRPVWTNYGCETFTMDKNITCRCNHMTFFAVLLTPLNETISTNDLNTLTIITRVGCGISMFFLGIILFMHFVLRRAKSSNSTKILIHLVLAMFLLVFAFLVNDFVAKAKNVIGCKIMAAVTHYFMLSTFSWFAVHAFHLCLQLYSGGNIKIRRYILKVSITSWVMPGVIGIVLLSLGKYGEVVINTGNAATSVAMCWIKDNEVHYIVNIGYYALVFIFTFSVFILMLTWICQISRKQKKNNVSSCQKIVTIMGLCCILGVTWGCAFFAYGIFRVPAYYCFTILNSLQGLCLFIYYYKTSHMVETKDPHSSSSTSTLKTNLDAIFNPYETYSPKPKPE